MPIVLSQKHVRISRKAFRVAIGVSCALMALSVVRLYATRERVTGLTLSIQKQNASLSSLRHSTRSLPAANETVALSGDPLSQLQLALEGAAAVSKCSIDEFQASPERTPYRSVFTPDTNEPDWMQTSVHVTFTGSLKATLEAVERLRKADLPMEPDSLEITRQGVGANGASVVSLRLAFRVLMKAGGKA